MMKLKILALLGFLTFSGFTSKPADVNFKCLVQLTNYSGEGAYVAVSLLDATGKYQKTLYIFGKEKRWYDDLTSWWKFYSAKHESVDAISGASITPGSRKVFSFSLDDAYFNKGYKLRFETAVENQDYKEKDLEFEFSSANVGKSLNGTGYIRYVKLIGS
ncbi:DUF2271 domain-containing protein [Jiulongibacter sediminis]|uniref:Periplasmic protein, FlgD ig superfamily n=1 Tax=Jiulongibacter sediminis TaxID=1605367 RepID=A0A0P7BAL1_9BACT|nr:DUF2271 domain-containing protein [Jiulongibacter sediminis]KPM47442.1 periplasmic protein, FlgD ig superfamily [Jiulongibacter sediminis]TBX23237.1 periplasmic protein, FlgD ig superfamily [Jiulongibacter sediminis]